MSKEVAAETLFRDVVDVVRGAISLGATRRGGPLTAAEEWYIGHASRRPRLNHDARDRLRTAILRGEDPLGDALLRLRSRERRRRSGSFYTPPNIVAPMVDWVLAQNPGVVVDPGCGSGRFAGEVARRRSDIQLLAIDKDPVATIVTRAVLEVLQSRRSTVLQTDFLALDAIARTRGRHVAWIGNPPYVRHQLFGRALKMRGVELAAQAGHTSQMTAGLHALFFTQTRLLSRFGDVGCYVTPSEWVDNRSGAIVRDLFLNGLGGESVLLLDPESFAFAGVKTTAAITCFTVGNESLSRRLAFQVPFDRLRAGLANLGEDVPKDCLTTSRGWTRVANNPTGMPDIGPTVGDLFHVHRGTATGANGFFVMTPTDARERGLAKYGVACVTRASEIIEAEGALRRRSDHKIVLSFPKTLDRDRERTVDAYLRHGERPDVTGLVVSGGSNAQKRSPWWSFPVSKPAIVATYMARRPPVFAANPDRLGILNIAIAIEPKIAMSAATVALAVAALNEAAGSFEEYAVRYFGNLRKFEPKTVASLPLPQTLHRLLAKSAARV